MGTICLLSYFDISFISLFLCFIISAHKANRNLDMNNMGRYLSVCLLFVEPTTLMHAIKYRRHGIDQRKSKSHVVAKGHLPAHKVKELWPIAKDTKG